MADHRLATFASLSSGMGKNWFDALFGRERGPVVKPQSEVQKLSEIINDMAVLLLRNPGVQPSELGADVAVRLASAAWNLALGDSNLRDQNLRFIRSPELTMGPLLWREFSSCDVEKLIGGLVVYKQTHHPDDARKIVKTTVSPDCHVQVQWTFLNPPAAPLDPAVRTGSPARRKVTRRSRKGRVRECRSE